MPFKRLSVRAIVAACSLLLCVITQAQTKAFFVDGYHGGCYGHYPKDYTGFIVEQLKAHPDWKICLEIEPETWDSVKVWEPVKYEEFKKFTESKRVEFTNPAYAQPYMYNISGESVIRQLAYGIKKVKSHFPDVKFDTYSVEEPCFTSCLPGILSGFGFKYASLKCPDTCWGGYTAPYGGELVNWIGPDGSSLLASPRYAAERLQEGTVWQTIAWGNTDEYLDACKEAGIKNPVGMCFQDAGWRYGPWIGYGTETRNGSEYVTWKEYFEEIADSTVPEDYHFTQEDVRPGLMWGSEVLDRIAGQARKAENALIATEKTGAMALLSNGFRYDQKEIDEAWRVLCLSQHHDSWIVPYNHLNSKGTWADNIALWTASAEEICAKIAAAARSSYSAGVSKAGGVVRVFNTLGHPRAGVVSVLLPQETGNVRLEDVNGKPVKSSVSREGDGLNLTFEAKTPAFGYSSYSIIKDSCPLQNGFQRSYSSEDGPVAVENGLYRIVFDPSRGGVITSLASKSDEVIEYVDSTSVFSFCELRGDFENRQGFVSSVDEKAVIKVTAPDPFVTYVEVEGLINGTRFTQTFTLKKDDPVIDVRLQVDWKTNEGIGDHSREDSSKAGGTGFYDGWHNLNVLFPLSLKEPSLFKDAPFDVCESELKTTRFNSWDDLKHNVMLHWIDLSECEEGKAMSLLSDRTTSYSFGEGIPLSLTVRYSGKGLWGRDYSITGPSDLRYAIVPHIGRWDKASVSQESDGWNEPLQCALLQDAALVNKSFFDVGDSGYEISAVHQTEGGLLLRLYNGSGDSSRKTVKFGFKAAEVREVDLNGNTLTESEAGYSKNKRELKVAMPRFGVRTFLIRLP